MCSQRTIAPADHATSGRSPARPRISKRIIRLRRTATCPPAMTIASVGAMSVASSRRCFMSHGRSSAFHRLSKSARRSTASFDVIPIELADHANRGAPLRLEQRRGDVANGDRQRRVVGTIEADAIELLHEAQGRLTLLVRRLEFRIVLKHLFGARMKIERHRLEPESWDGGLLALLEAGRR